MQKRYCSARNRSIRFPTREVLIGKIGVGGNNPIRIQSMTTSDTRNISETIRQIIRLADSGCEIVRVTVQGVKEAEACTAIKSGLLQKGYDIPLVADIHFYPPAALHVIESVDKVRINPGNFADKRMALQQLFHDPENDDCAALERIEERFAPLVQKCITLKKALRIGVNHGSLSGRIMMRYGDTPQGMVESAFEYARICRKYGFHDFVFSMKASNPLIMIQAYRYLVAEMIEMGWDYPIHVGVTEAGAEQEGRVKSAVGIGALLIDGIGDTIRVSLTEEPWQEIAPCQELIALQRRWLSEGGIPPFVEKNHDFMSLTRTRKPVSPPLHPDGSVLNAGEIDGQAFVNIDHSRDWHHLLERKYNLVCITASDCHVHKARHFFAWAREEGLSSNVLLGFDYSSHTEDIAICAAAECGSLLADGLGDGLALITSLSQKATQDLSFNILQAVRMRMTKTDYISCPGCGRTLFDLQNVAKNIREETAHLPGVKIAIMGCIVNGPGEMADADFGFVGSRPGMIDLYLGKECVEKGIVFADAVEKLIALIKAQGRWVDKVDLTVL